MSVLNKRLICAAELLEKGCVTADIGTDHAFLPIYLINQNICSRVIASDIAEKPLAVAAENIKKRNLQDKISLRLAAGLDGIAPNECNAVTITGMGGETIAEIIAAAGWLCENKTTLVLQPMTCDDRLRQFLDQNGFNIEIERAVQSMGRIYTVMRARYTGKLPEKSPAFRYIGKLGENRDEFSYRLLQKRLKSLKKCAEQLKSVPYKQTEREKMLPEIAELERVVNGENFSQYRN